MTYPTHSRPANRAGEPSDTPFSLQDLVQALCSGLSSGVTAQSWGLELMLDRIERTR
ncbi:hypothetical protein [Thioclava sp. SK-1]|uniref:hypothetical protein n=1 Tax=Thioclava sp. SK-1 TaxID=1889770 RepID=UPI00159F0603|nr:hypothetical protein [Thioclava sp. SK-1]